MSVSAGVNLVETGPIPVLNLTKKPRKWLRRMAVVVALLILGVAGGVYYYYRASIAEFEAAIAELDRLDPGWRMEEAEGKRQDISDANNSALQLIATRNAIGGQVRGLFAPMKALSGIPVVQLKPDEIARLKKQLDSCKVALIEARKFESLPEGCWPMRPAPLREASPALGTSSLEHVSRLLSLDAAF